MRGWRSSATRRARSRARTTSGRSARWASAARRCRASRRSRASRCGRARAAQRPAPRSASRPAAVVSVREVGAPEGTSIEVADLFYNLPARRKFLKSDTAEAAQISRLMTQIALGLSGGRLHADERRPPACCSARRRRGSPSASFSSSASARIWSASTRRPAACRSTASSRRSATRGRSAARRTSSSTAASSRTAPSRTRSSRPTASRRSRNAAPRSTCSSRLPPDRVDVNVHPTKAEVRFLEQSLVHEVLRRALGDALGQGRAPELQLSSSCRPAPAEPQPMTIPGVLAGADRSATAGVRSTRPRCEPALIRIGRILGPRRACGCRTRRRPAMGEPATRNTGSRQPTMCGR